MFDNYINMEEKLWQYIDGECSPEERMNIELLFRIDPVWKKKYDELVQFNKELHDDIPLEHPSLRFSKNVMEQIEPLHVAKPAGVLINKKIIYAIAALFILIIGGALVYSLITADWTDASLGINYTLPSLKPKVNYGQFFKDNYIMIIMLFNIIPALLFLDKWLSSRKRSVE